MTRSGRLLRLLLLNWQDREHPRAGGAEVHLHEIFGRLAGRGHDVRAVVGGWSGATGRVTLDGIRVRRVGDRHSYPLRVPGAARRALREEPADLLIEDINKLPLASPGWAPCPVVALVPHLFGTTAFREASWPVAATVWAAERLIPRVYRGVPFQAISRSTADDLVARGIDRTRITVIEPGIDHEVFRPGEEARDPRPTIVYVGRLKRYKGLDVLPRALARLRRGGLDARLLIAGRGDDRRRLQKIAAELELGDAVRFLGYVAEAEKVRLLRRAWVAAYPSPKEGWGITNIEAAACGTPVVASDSPGLRDSVDDGVSGRLVRHGDPAAWARALAALLTDRARLVALREGALRHADRFSWDRAADETEAHLRAAVGQGA